MPKRVLGTEHPEVFLSENDLANVLSGRGTFPEAARILRETQEAQTWGLGVDHQDGMLSSATHLAAALSALVAISEAARIGDHGVGRADAGREGWEACRGLGLRSATVVLGAGDHEFLGGLGSLRDCGAEVAPRRRSGDCRALRRSGGDGLMDSGAQVVLRRRSGDLSGIAHSGGLPDSCPIDGREVSKFLQINVL